MKPVFVLLVFVIIISYNFLRKNRNNVRCGKRAPEPGGAWPIIGHLHLLGGGDQLLYRTLGAMADKYGPTFGIRLGTRNAFIVSRWEEAKECFTVNDRALTSRPVLAATRLMCYDCAMFGMAPYSDYWRGMRRIVTQELLAHSRLDKLRHVWEAEVHESIAELHGLCAAARPAKVNLTQWFEHLMLNIIIRLIAGKRYSGASAGGCDESEAIRCKDVIDQFFHMFGIFVVSDALPFLGWFDPQGHEKAMKETFKKVDPILEGWLREHRTRRDSCKENEATSERNFIDLMLSIEEEGRFSNFPFDADTCIKSTCLSIILGSGGTTSVPLIWATSLLLNNQHALKKARQELDSAVGPNRAVHETDLKNLPYLQAIIDETLRLYPPGPLLAPREAIEDCHVGGYQVLAGTRLVVNVWKIQRDPNIWADPFEFRPERFITSEGSLIGPQITGLMPFGSGRRSCPGGFWSRQVLQLTLGRIIHGFDLGKIEDRKVDMTESPGLSLPKATPLEVLISPRVDRDRLYA